MPRVLITGGTGGLGSELVPRFAAVGYTIRVLSRGPKPHSSDVGWGPSPDEWAQCDLTTGAGINDAVAGCDLIVHAATGAGRRAKVDIAGTRKLVAAAKAASTPHLFYISIVGIERIPLGYYKAKLACERMIEDSGVPWSNLRATQFHSLIDTFTSVLSRLPGVLFLPKAFKFQPVDTGEVAERMVEYAAKGPSGRLPDLGGPQVLTWGEMAADWLQARGQRKTIVNLPVFGRIAAGFRNGYNCLPADRHGTPEHADGKMTWSQWLERKYGGRDG
ncbi:MAG: NAD-dependent epimerase/dehydratase family protein [Chloroflexi bacterium]|nr:MAG: NAD-dependent epimerase/dehydratase family protein [Chloroflexota bacterium]